MEETATEFDSPSVNGDETTDTEKETQENESTEESTDETADEVEETDVSDYGLSDNASDEEETYKKRYSDSSREAQRLAAELSAKQKEIDEWIQTVRDNPEISEVVSKVTGKNFGDDKKLEILEQKLERLERQSQDSLLRSFEAEKVRLGFKFTPEIRRQIGGIVKSLEGVMPYDEALEIAHIRLNKSGLVKNATETGKKQALAESMINSSATYTTSNSSNSDAKKYSLTKEEAEYISHLPEEERKGFIEYHRNKNK